MRRRFPYPLARRAAVAALSCLLVLSCSDSGDPEPITVVAQFTPLAPTPADGSVTLQAGEATGMTFSVRVSAKGIEDFFGGSFWITYNTTVVAFAGFDDSASFLRDGGAAVETLVDAAEPAGQVKVGITRIQNQEGTIPGVDVTTARDLIILTFTARTTTSGTTLVFADEQRQVSDSANPIANPITVTWAGGILTVL